MPCVIVVVAFEQDNAPVGRDGVEDHRQSRALLVRVGLADPGPDGAFAARAAFDGIGDEDRIVGHLESVNAIGRDGQAFDRAARRVRNWAAHHPWRESGDRRSAHTAVQRQVAGWRRCRLRSAHMGPTMATTAYPPAGWAAPWEVMPYALTRQAPLRSIRMHRRSRGGHRPHAAFNMRIRVSGFRN